MEGRVFRQLKGHELEAEVNGTTVHSQRTFATGVPAFSGIVGKSRGRGLIGLNANFDVAVTCISAKEIPAQQYALSFVANYGSKFKQTTQTKG